LGKLILNQHPTFRTISDVAAVFGVPSSAIRKGIFYKGAVDLSSTVTIWWPKILPLSPRAGGWTNKPTCNSTNEVVEIEERNKNTALNLNHLSGLLQQNCQRIVFGNFKLGSGYEYLGVFELDKQASSAACVWKRVATDWKIV